MTAKVRIVLADDHPIVLDGLRSVIQACGEFELAGAAATGIEALAVIREKGPDVAVVDLSMPGFSGVALIKRIVEECPSVRIVVLTAYEDKSYLNQALQSGARGYVLKRSLSDNLLHAIRAVMLGGVYVDPPIAAQVIGCGDLSPERTRTLSSIELTSREAEVLRFMALGETHKEIAGHLHLSVKSVETFKARAVKKVGLRTRADIVRYAAAQGWLHNL